MLEYRDLDYHNDLDEVVQLINNNLDPYCDRDSLLWKHCENPLGKSFSMVATDASRIVGVVFFIHYHFKSRDGNLTKCLRPVDVCTNVEYRGKGIFKNLVVKSLQKYKNHYDVSFANANQNSYPAFTKMKWKELEHSYSFNIGIFSPFVLLKKNKLNDFDFNESSNGVLNYQDFRVVGNSIQFIKWRYKNNVYKIREFQTNDGKNYVVYRVEKVKNVSCIILCDYYGDANLVEEVVKQVCGLEKLFIVYYVNNEINKTINFVYKRKVKEVLILYTGDEDLLKSKTVLSLGDLEARI